MKDGNEASFGCLHTSRSNATVPATNGSSIPVADLESRFPLTLKGVGSSVIKLNHFLLKTATRPIEMATKARNHQV